ncbi:MAG: hypothetical protein MZV49_05485 [Rhodopseudomonas palustris]|nr:hypothetical protein [Rhodopseudomonas palustris]
MVRGLNVFARYFAGFEDRFVLIGGAACDLWLTKSGLTPRATKDLDIVLVIEAVEETFVRKFWDFIRAGRYARSESPTGPRKYYRFIKPQNPEYPQMIELFSRHPDILGEGLPGSLLPVILNTDISSLSAILLDNEVYGFILGTRRFESGVMFISPQGLIPLKALAYLDLKARKARARPLTATMSSSIGTMPSGWHYCSFLKSG